MKLIAQTILLFNTIWVLQIYQTVTLALYRSNNSAASVNGLIRAFSHPSSKFKGSGSVLENLGTYHQQFMNVCKTFNLTEKEAFMNLYILFETGSEAGRFCYKHALNKAKNLTEAFEMLYRRFMSNERRDRLIRKWTGLKLSNFHKDEKTRHTSLREMCDMASSIQLQLGPSYQDDQHLRDTLLGAFKDENLAHRLATMPTIKLLDVQESLARVITAEEEYDSVKHDMPVTQLAFPKDINFTQDRPGIPYRRYGGGRGSKHEDGKNPIRNHTSLLCKVCDSDTQFLRGIPRLSPSKRVQQAKRVYSVDSMASDSDECFLALDVIPDYNDDE